MVPYMCGYEGWSIFVDCDFLSRGNIVELFKLRDDTKAVQVVKHDYVPQEETKFLGNVQTKYEKKNWSSLMLFNNSRCTALTPDYVNKASGLELHQFKWLHDKEVGELPTEWNHLVGEYGYDPKAKMVHFTLGGPWFKDYETVDYAEEWFYEHKLLARRD
jgi:lipopolysaccharide biosynthesis glycosyltransferase